MIRTGAANQLRIKLWEPGMEIGYALTDATTCHFRIDVAERSDKALIDSIAKGDNNALNNPEASTEKKSRGASSSSV